MKKCIWDENPICHTWRNLEPESHSLGFWLEPESSLHGFVQRGNEAVARSSPSLVDYRGQSLRLV